MHRFCRFIFSIIVLAAVARAEVQGQEISGSLDIRLLSPFASTAEFNTKVWENPAIRYDMMDVNLSSVKLFGRLESNDGAYIDETGYSDREFGASAESYTAISPSVKLYGGASYSYIRDQDMLWNHNADYNLIYPYVVGDSIGGYQFTKRYKFNGGYIKRFNKWSIGAEMDYRVLTAYSDKDPRPKNTVSDLTIKGSAAINLRNYSIGTALKYRNYKQSSDVDYYADSGATSLYHMVGLGVDMVRFGGTYDATRHRGYSYGASFDVVPYGGYGLALSASFDMLNITKQINSLNNAPVSDIAESTFAVAASYLLEGNTLEGGVLLELESSNRKGVESILGDATGGIYEVIVEHEMYGAKSLDGALSLRLGNDVLYSWKGGWNVTPRLGYNYISESYATDDLSYKVSNFDFGASVNTFWKMRKAMLKVSASGAMRNNLRSDSSIEALDITKSVTQSLMRKISFYSDNYTTFSVDTEINIYIKPKLALAVGAAYRGYIYDTRGKVHIGEANIHMKF